MSNPLTTFLFDVGDTLIRPAEPLHILYLNVINKIKNTSIDPELFRQTILDLQTQSSLMLDGHFRYSDLWFSSFIYRVLEIVDCPKPWDGIMENLFKLFEKPSSFYIFPDVSPCLQKLGALNIKTAIVSNWGYRLDKLLQCLGLANGFDPIISSADVESEKPDPRIFKLALKGTKSRADQTVHIGDNFDCDIKGGRAAGIHTVLIDRNNSLPDKKNRITTLDQLFDHLKDRGFIIQS